SVSFRVRLPALPRLRRWHPLNRSLYLGYKVLLAGLLMTQKADRVAMANSVETRFKIREAARTLDTGDTFRPSTGISRIARKFAAPNLSFGELARLRSAPRRS